MDKKKLLEEELEHLEMYIPWMKFKEKSVMWDKPMKIGFGTKGYDVLTLTTW